MDSLTKWTGCWFLAQEVHNEWSRRYEEDGLEEEDERDKRFNEIHAAILFARFLEQQEQKDYYVGFRVAGRDVAEANIEKLFEIMPEWDQDVDILLAPGADGKASEDALLQVQVTRFWHQELTDDHTADISHFIIDKKFTIPKDDDLVLLVHIQEGVYFNYEILSANLIADNCPYGRVYIMGRCGPDDTHCWLCIQVCPTVARLRNLDYSFLDDSSGVNDAKID